MDWARAVEESSPPPSVVYSFLEALPRAQASWKGAGKTLAGVWEEDRFRFEGQAGVTDIFATDAALVEGKPRLAIWLQPYDDLEATLTFSDLPPGRQLHLFYALPDPVFQQAKLIPVYLEVWIGQKKLFETRVNSKGWKEKTVDLTLPFLLQRRFLIRVKVWAAEKQSSSFIFYARIE